MADTGGLPAQGRPALQRAHQRSLGEGLGRGHLLQQPQIPHYDGLTVQNDVKALIPGVTPGRHGALPAGSQVSRLLLPGPLEK
jgi:hypothetical protein